METASHEINPHALYPPETAGEILLRPATTLANWRYRGGGPRFVKTGRRVLYRGQDLLNYLDQHTYSNTREAAQ